MEEDLSVHTDDVDGGISRAGIWYPDSGPQMSPFGKVTLGLKFGLSQLKADLRLIPLFFGPTYL